jgi:hypothetical protein
MNARPKTYSAWCYARSSSADPIRWLAVEAPIASWAKPQTDSLIYPLKAIPHSVVAEEQTVQQAAAWIWHCSVLLQVRGPQTALQYCALPLRSAKLSALRRLRGESFC